MSSCNAFCLALGVAVLAAAASGATLAPLDSQYRFSLFFEVDPSAAGYMFMPAIDAATMQPFQFAFASRDPDQPAAGDPDPYSIGNIAPAYSTYASVFGSGASTFMLFIQQNQIDPDDDPARYLPRYLPGPEMMWGQAPEWDPDNLPALDVIIFPEDPLPEDPAIEEPPVDTEDSLFQSLVFVQDGAGPVVVLDAPLDVSVPEPSTWLLAGTGGLLVIARRWRRKRSGR